MIKPIKLFVAADGPRLNNESDIQKCKEVKEIIDGIDWDCEVVTLFRESNLGCKYAVSGAISWFFNQVEEGIILEDDIFPDISFFNFCQTLLRLYKNDDRVMHISGFNVAERWMEKKQVYHASFFGSIWGWASWRRAWQYYDVDLKNWRNAEIQNEILTKYFPIKVRDQRKKLYDDVYNGLIDTWDYQWTFSRLLRGGISLIPSVNLIENIGFHSQATHSQTQPFWMPKRLCLRNKAINRKEKLTVDRYYDHIHNQIASGNFKSRNWFNNYLKSYFMRWV